PARWSIRARLRLLTLLWQPRRRSSRLPPPALPGGCSTDRQGDLRLPQKRRYQQAGKIAAKTVVSCPFLQTQSRSPPPQALVATRITAKYESCRGPAMQKPAGTERNELSSPVGNPDEAVPDSEVHLINVHRRLDAQFDEVFREPVARTFSPLVAKKNEKVPIGGVELAFWTECPHEFVVGDAVDQHLLQLAIDDAILRDELGHEADRPHLPHQRRIEADLASQSTSNYACSSAVTPLEE